MPESKSRKKADEKKKVEHHRDEVAHRREKSAVAAPGSRRWVPPTFIAVALIGVAWLVVFYVTSATGVNVPFMNKLGNWNIGIGMGLMAASFGIATLWR